MIDLYKIIKSKLPFYGTYEFSKERKIIIIFLLFLVFISGCNFPNTNDHYIQKEIEELEKQIYTQSDFESVMFSVEVHTETPISEIPQITVPTPTPTQTQTLTPVFILSATPTLGPDYFHGSLWYEPGYVSQEGLLYNGKPINTGCTAASVQMLLDFWHDYKAEYPTMSAQTLIDLNAIQKQFNPSTGLNITNTEDDLNKLNYYLGTRQDSNKEELLTALERYGPILILTKSNWTPFGANHMAVVTGYDSDTDIIRILDPLQIGGIMEFPYDNFDGIWSLNYLDDISDTLQRTFFFIIPYAELGRENEPFIPYRELEQIHNVN